MTILILHRGRFSAFRYDRWLADQSEDIVLLASAEHLEGEPEPPADFRCRHVEVIADWDAGGVPEARVLELARQFRFTQLVARHERDLLRAAALREILGLPGHRLAEALAFRDKARMKELARDAGLAVARHSLVEDWADAVSFADRNGFPVVVKPRAGAGATDNWTVHSMDELVATLDGPLAGYRSRPSNLLIEAFVRGPMYHVDGLAVAGKLVLAWPSQYLDPLSSFRARPVRLDVMLDERDELTEPLLGFTQLLMQALPSPQVCAFHAEVFREPSGELVLCEVACRTGGARIRHIMEAAFGVDLIAAAVRGQLGLDVPELDPAMPLPSVMAGQILVMKRPGTVVSVPAAVPLPGVHRYQAKVTVGERLAGAGFSGDVAASAVVTGPSAEVVEQRLRDVRSWLDQELIIR